MTSEILQMGINAARDLNELILEWNKKGIEDKEIVKAQNDLKDITDVFQESFLDMVKVDTMREQIKTMNQTLDEYLNRFQ